MVFNDTDLTKGFYKPNALSAFEIYFPKDKYEDYYDTELVVSESINNLIKVGDIIRIHLSDKFFKDCEKYLVVETNHLPKGYAWKFALIDDMKD